ncbi:MAG: hypothetical protein ACLF0G_01560 [Candidatus Brocadiia bacterium]
MAQESDWPSEAPSSAPATPAEGGEEAPRRKRRWPVRLGLVVVSGALLVVLFLLLRGCERWRSWLGLEPSLKQASEAWRQDHLGTLSELPYHPDFQLTGLSSLADDPLETYGPLVEQMQPLHKPIEPARVSPLPPGLAEETIRSDLEQPWRATYEAKGGKEITAYGGRSRSPGRARGLVDRYEGSIAAASPVAEASRMEIENRRGKVVGKRLQLSGPGAERAVFLLRADDGSFVYIFVCERSAEAAAKELVRALKAENEGLLEYDLAARLIRSATRRPSDQWVAVAGGVRRIPDLDDALRAMRQAAGHVRDDMPAFARFLDATGTALRHLAGRRAIRTVFLDRSGHRVVCVTRVAMGSTTNAIDAAEDTHAMMAEVGGLAESLIGLLARQGGPSLGPGEREQAERMIRKVFRVRGDRLEGLAGRAYSWLFLCGVCGWGGEDLVFIDFLDLGKVEGLFRAARAGADSPAELEGLLSRATFGDEEYEAALGVCRRFAELHLAESAGPFVMFVVR